MSHCLLSIQCRSAWLSFSENVLYGAPKGTCPCKKLWYSPPKLWFACKTLVMEIMVMGGKTVSICLHSFLGQHNSFVKKKTQVFLRVECRVSKGNAILQHESIEIWFIFFPPIIFFPSSCPHVGSSFLFCREKKLNKLEQYEGEYMMTKSASEIANCTVGTRFGLKLTSRP